MGKVLTYKQRFLESTRSQRGGMVRRGAAEYSKDGKRLLRPEVPVQFSLEEYREWVLKFFGGEDKAQPCSYQCGAWITPLTFVPDHVIPLARNGPNALKNLTPCCQSCNDIKGELDGVTYAYLRRCLDQMAPGQAAMIYERLAKSEKAASSVRALRGRVVAMQKATGGLTTNPNPPRR